MISDVLWALERKILHNFSQKNKELTKEMKAWLLYPFFSYNSHFISSRPFIAQLDTPWVPFLKTTKPKPSWTRHLLRPASALPPSLRGSTSRNVCLPSPFPLPSPFEPLRTAFHAHASCQTRLPPSHQESWGAAVDPRFIYWWHLLLLTTPSRNTPVALMAPGPDSSSTTVAVASQSPLRAPLTLPVPEMGMLPSSFPGHSAWLPLYTFWHPGCYSQLPTWHPHLDISSHKLFTLGSSKSKLFTSAGLSASENSTARA